MASQPSGRGCLERTGPGPWGRFVEGIASKIAFFPPTPPSYEVLEHNDGTGELYIQPVDRSYPRVPSAAVSRVSTRPLRCGGGGTTIITAFLPYRDGRGRQARATLLYSHGNAVDLGQMLPMYRELGRALRVNVFGYDYSGYGASSGTPSTRATCADISAALEALQQRHGVQPRDVVVYGQSIGSGPSVWLCAQPSAPPVAGLVLHSPLLSGVRVLHPGLRYWPSWADIYPNHQLIRRCKVPLLVMHGTADEVISVTCGMKLVELAGAAAAEPLWAAGYDHQNLEACPQYLPRLKAFLAQLFPEDYKAGSGGGGAGSGGGTSSSVSNGISNGVR